MRISKRRIVAAAKQLVLTAFICGCTSEKGEWDEAREMESVTAYQDFLSRYPDGVYRDSALSRMETLRFEEVRAAATVQAYERFLSDFPESSFAAAADSLIIDLLPRIVFFSDRDGVQKVYTMRLDGSEQTPAGEGVFPALSPDGTQIAFTSDRDGNGEIYMMDLDGTGLVRLTESPAGDFMPAWSPDGTRIAFVSHRDGNAEIYAVNVDGTEMRRLTNNPGADAYPAWSPDGTQIAFTSHRSGDEELLTMQTAVEDFAFPPRNMFMVSDWSGDIYVMNTDGTRIRCVADHPANDSHPTWSPDGTSIAFTSTRDGNAEIYLMHLDGSGPIRLTENLSEDRVPRWYGARNKIVFNTDRDEGVNIYVMNADGTDPVPLTTGPAWNFVGQFR